MTLVGKEPQPTEVESDHIETSTERPKDKNMFDDITEDSKAPVTDDDTVENSQLPGVTMNSIGSRGVINHESYQEDELMISSEEKSAFIEAMITGDRYRQSYQIFGGKINVTLRSRTTKETQAMYAYIRHALSSDGGNLSLLEGDMQYLMLIAQVEELNGVKFPEMKEPLHYSESDGKTSVPGWLDDLITWKNKPEGLTSAIVNRIQLFEYKYWTMVKEASNKNFWNTGTSTAE